MGACFSCEDKDVKIKKEGRNVTEASTAFEATAPPPYYEATPPLPYYITSSERNLIDAMSSKLCDKNFARENIIQKQTYSLLPSIKKSNVLSDASSSRTNEISSIKSPIFNQLKEKNYVPLNSNVNGANSGKKNYNRVKNYAAPRSRNASSSVQKFSRPKQDYTVTVSTVIDGKFVCLICDARGMSSQSVLDDHIRGKKHRENLANYLKPGASMDVKHQKILMDNTVTMLDDDFICFACNTKKMSENTAFTHIKSQKHLKAVADFKSRY